MARTFLSRFGFAAAGIAALIACGPAGAADDVAAARKAFLEAVVKRDEAGVRAGAEALAAADNRQAVAVLLQGYAALAGALHGEITAKLDPLQKEIDEIAAKAEAEREEAAGQKDKSGELKRLNKKRQNLQEQVNALEADADRLRKLLAVIPEQLGRMKNPEAVDELVSGAKKKGTEWGLRAGMVEVLGTSDHPDAMKTLLGLVSPKEEPAAGVRIAAITALARKGGKEAVAAIGSALSDPFWQVQASAVDALKGLNAKEAAGDLIEALKDAKGAMKERINGALVALTGVDKHGDYATWKDWRESAATAAGGEAGGGAPPAPAPLDGARGGAAPLVLKGGQGGMTSFYGIPIVSKRLVFILDRSGSMKEPADWKTEEKVTHSGPAPAKPDLPPLGNDPKKIDVAKHELATAIRGLPEDVEFNVIFYHGGLEIWRKDVLQPATKANKDAAIAFVRDIQAKGSTNIYDPLKAALELQGSVPAGGKGAAAPRAPAGKPGMTTALTAPVLGGADTIYLLSDGLPTAGSIKKPEKILEKVGEDNKVLKITVHTIGVGMKKGKAGGDFLKKLAENTGGTFVER